MSIDIARQSLLSDIEEVLTLLYHQRAELLTFKKTSPQYKEVVDAMLVVNTENINRLSNLLADVKLVVNITHERLQDFYARFIVHKFSEGHAHA